MNAHHRFPKNFTWGYAAAAPQIEGAWNADGKGESIWDHAAHTTRNIHDGDTLDVANDHYHLYKQDFAAMRKFGTKNYRLSLAWPRIFPEGRGALNQKGVDFYHRLIDAMLKEGIKPWVTMFHWDLPQALEEKGGWKSRATTDAFAIYADTIVKAYGDRVKNWITLNEIVCFTRFGYGGADKAPFRNDGEAAVNQTYHHAIMCHGHGVRAVREHGGRGARVGLTDNSWVTIPLMETPADIAAAKERFVMENWRILEPIYKGAYHPGYLRAAGKDRPKVEKGDLALASLPTDFLGMNIYTGWFVRAGKGGKPEQFNFPPSYPTADAPWLYHASDALYWGPRWVREIYKVPAVYITENGAGYNDKPPVNGELIDLHRRNYIRDCLKHLHRATKEGIPVKGYFLWSFMDNFEWQDGYARRFGAFYNEYKTQKRTPKLTAHWYKQVMEKNQLL